MLHQTLINALARQGLNPERDPNDSNIFWIEVDGVQGQWTKNHDGRVFVAITRENDQVKGNATINEFLRSLKKPLHRKNGNNMH